ncbi:MAG: Spy0128 family protein, partial [Coriobacteriales bacterium]
KGYYFAGWRTATDEELEKNPYAGKRYSDGQEITDLDGNVTLYAQWEKLKAWSYNGTFYVQLKPGQKAVFSNLPVGCHYSVVESSAPGWTLSSSSGTAGTVTQSTSTASFVNKFTPGSTNVTIAASKLLTGLSPDDGTFTFNLYEGDQATGNPIQTATNVGSSVTFDPITFTYDANEWQGQDYQYRTYTIAEVLPEDDDPNTEGVQKDGITYDQHIEHAYVEIRHSVQDGKDMLGASAYYDWNDSTPYQALFTNVPGPGNLTISKQTVGQSSATSDKDFKFTVSLMKDSKLLTDEYDWTSSDGRSGTVTSGGTITLKGGQTATITGLPAGTTYFVKEASVGENWSQTASSDVTGIVKPGGSSAASFTNTYSASGEAVLKGTKVVKNHKASYRDYKKGEFEFALYKGTDTAGAPIQTVSNGSPNASGKSTFSFDPLGYTMEDLSNGDGTYAQEKDLTYTIVEMPGISAKYGYDTQKWTATVHLSDQGDGTIKTSVSYKNASGNNATATFANQFLPAGSATVHATKRLEGRELSNGEFTVVCKYASDSAEAFRMKNSGKSFTSPRLKFTQGELDKLVRQGRATKKVSGDTVVWTITYVMSELLPEDDNASQPGVQKGNVTYDESVHTVTVTFTDNGAKTLGATVTYDAGTETPPVFKNLYRIGGNNDRNKAWDENSNVGSTSLDESGSSGTPETGDTSTGLALMAALFCAGAVLIVVRRRRHGDDRG